MLIRNNEREIRRSAWRELWTLLDSSAEVWRLIPIRARIALVTAAILMGGAAWINARIPVALGALANTISVTQHEARQWTLVNARDLLLALALMFLLREVLQVIRKYLVHKTTTNIEKNITIELVSKLLYADLGSLSQDRVGALNGRIRRSAEGFVRFLLLCFMDFVPSVLTALFAVSVALHRHILLGIVMAGVAPIATLIVVRQVASQKGVRLELLRSKESVDATVVEQLSGIEYVRAADTHAKEIERIERVCEGVRSRELRHHVQMSLFDFLKAINESAFFILVVAFSIALVARGELPAGEIITFSMLFASILTPLREIHRIMDEAHESALKVRDLLRLMAEPTDRSFAIVHPMEPELGGQVPAIELRNVSLEYLTVEGVPRKGLSNVSLRIPTNSVVGVAGYSGSGKSTWLRALLRLAHPSRGEIMIGGVPISQVSRDTLARLVGYVSQTPFLFAGTMAENIAYGCDNVTTEQLTKAAAAADVLDDILGMPGGFQAPVYEGGRNLSGGQRQRIAIARVFLKNPPIIILDEATSALDTSTERRVQEALNRCRVDRTVIMVAHRLSTLRDAQVVYVFDKGSVVQVGSFDDLASSPGIFAELLANSGSPSANGRSEDAVRTAA